MDASYSPDRRVASAAASVLRALRPETGMS